jgi:hypothetical protein
MRQYPQQTFGFLRGPATRAQGRSEAALVARDGALDLPALAVNTAEEAPFHLPAVFGRGPRSGAAFARGNDGRTDAELFPAQHMVVFGVVAGIGQEPVEADVASGLNHSRGKLRRVLRGAETHEGAGQKMALPMADQRQLRPAKTGMAFVSPAPDVVAAHVTALQARGIDDALGAFLPDQCALPRPLEDDSLEKNEGVFFRSLRSAYERVE